MAISASNVIANASASDLDSYSTASVSVTSGRLYLLFVRSTKDTAGTANTPTVTGASQTWTQVATRLNAADSKIRTTLFRCVATSTTSGALTIDFAGQTQTFAGWIVDEIVGANPNNNGADAIVQSTTGDSNGASVTSFSLTLSAFASASNAVWAGIRVATATTTVTHEGGGSWSELVESGTTGASKAESQFRASSDTSPSWTLTSDVVAGAIAVEITADVSVSAGVSSATGAALNPSITIAPNAGVASATAAAYDATVSLLSPPRTVVINGTDYTSKIRWDSFEFTETANRGEVGVGKVLIDDSAGALDIPAHRAFAFEEPAAGPANKYVFSGYSWDRTTQRGPNMVAGQREWVVEAVDLNTLADDYILTDAESADRPAETDYVRVAWLLTSRFNSVGGVGVGYVPNANTVNLDAVDYRGRTPREVLNQCSEAAGKNWFLYNHDGTVDLFYDVTSSTNLSTSSRISDVLSDVDNSTTWAGTAASVHKSPDDIYSTVHFRWNEGTVTVTNATTASNYRTREISLTDTSVDSSAKATAKANAFLAAAAYEKISVDSITVKLPAANVNDFRAGQRCQIKLSRHGISSFTYYRILRRTVKPADDTSYYVTLTFTDQVLPTIFGSQRGGDIYGIWEKKSNATDDGATVIVDRAGINIIDGAITVVNSGATVIIDGESDMFKIAAEGTQNHTVTSGNASATNTTLTGLGTLTASPAHLLYVADDDLPEFAQALGYEPFANTLSAFVASASGGSPTTRVFAATAAVRGWVSLNVSDQAVVNLHIANGTGSSQTQFQKYFVLQETVF